MQLVFRSARQGSRHRARCVACALDPAAEDMVDHIPPRLRKAELDLAQPLQMGAQAVSSPSQMDSVFFL